MESGATRLQGLLDAAGVDYMQIHHRRDFRATQTALDTYDPNTFVEFAKVEHEKGKPLVEAALEGARLRLRPILMTSFAFILGCVPLAIASGAGAVSRQQMGIAVIMGMLVATLVGIFLTPVLFVVIERLGQRRSGGHE